MERLFKEDGVYSGVANQLDLKISNAIKNVLSKEDLSNYDIRDIQNIILTAAFDVSTSEILNRRYGK